MSEGTICTPNYRQIARTQAQQGIAEMEALLEQIGNSVRQETQRADETGELSFAHVASIAAINKSLRSVTKHLKD